MCMTKHKFVRTCHSEKSRFNIALGCTGGRHRSVVMANHLGGYFEDKGYFVDIAHRDIAKS